MSRDPRNLTTHQPFQCACTNMDIFSCTLKLGCCNDHKTYKPCACICNQKISVKKIFNFTKIILPNILKEKDHTKNSTSQHEQDLNQILERFKKTLKTKH